MAAAAARNPGTFSHDPIQWLVLLPQVI